MWFRTRDYQNTLGRKEPQGHLGVWKGGSVYTELRYHLQRIVGNWDNQLELSVDSCALPSRSADGDHHGEKGRKTGKWNSLIRGRILGLGFRGGRTKVGTETCLFFFSVQKLVLENTCQNTTLSLVLVWWNTVNKTNFLARGLPSTPALWTDLCLLSNQRGWELANGTLNLSHSLYGFYPSYTQSTNLSSYPGFSS